jgi:hypothetical protein
MVTLDQQLALAGYALRGPVWHGEPGDASTSSLTGYAELLQAPCREHGLVRADRYNRVDGPCQSPEQIRKRNARLAKRQHEAEVQADAVAEHKAELTRTERRIEQLRLLGGEDFIPAVERAGQAAKANGAKRAKVAA